MKINQLFLKNLTFYIDIKNKTDIELSNNQTSTASTIIKDHNEADEEAQDQEETGSDSEDAPSDGKYNKYRDILKLLK